MKVNGDGRYEVIEGENYIIDPETKQKVLFMMDPNKKLVVRSMMEEDIKDSIAIMSISSSKKRKNMKLLWGVIPIEGSEKYYYVIERIVEEDPNKNPYELEREIIGVGVRADDSVQFNVLKKEAPESLKQLEMLIERVAREFGIEGEVRPIKKS